MNDGINEVHLNKTNDNQLISTNSIKNTKDNINGLLNNQLSTNKTNEFINNFKDDRIQMLNNNTSELVTPIATKIKILGIDWEL